MEEREKVVKHMWDIYTNSRRIRIPRFWQVAFEAAFEDLTSDVPGVREEAISEIAKMSVRSVDLDPPPVQSTVHIPFFFFSLKLYILNNKNWFLTTGINVWYIDAGGWVWKFKSSLLVVVYCITYISLLYILGSEFEYASRNQSAFSFVGS